MSLCRCVRVASVIVKRPAIPYYVEDWCSTQVLFTIIIIINCQIYLHSKAFSEYSLLSTARTTTRHRGEVAMMILTSNQKPRES